MPNLYVYNADNPPEATIAKRRALAAVIDHMQTTFVQSGLYDELEQADQLISRYEHTKQTDSAQAEQNIAELIALIRASKIASQIRTPLTEANFEKLTEEIHDLLSLIRNTQIADGMHILGDIPQGEDRVNMIYSIMRYESMQEPGLRSLLCRLYGFDFEILMRHPARYYPNVQMDGGSVLEHIEVIGREAVRRMIDNRPIDETLDPERRFIAVDFETLPKLRELSVRIQDINARIENSTEIENLLHAMDGGYVKAGP